MLQSLAVFFEELVIDAGPLQRLDDLPVEIARPGEREAHGELAGAAAIVPVGQDGRRVLLDPPGADPHAVRIVADAGVEVAGDDADLPGLADDAVGQVGEDGVDRGGHGRSSRGC